VRRDLARALIRTLYAVVFVAGGAVHAVRGRADPEGYRVFGDTALVGRMSAWWTSFVMPNIGWLTWGVAAFEIACGLALLWRGHAVTWAAWAIVAFLAFVAVLGYGFPTSGVVEDLLKNRLATIVMGLAVAPLLTGPPPAGIGAAWRAARGAGSARRGGRGAG